MHWIFLSPHMDDVAISCAGLVWELSQQGQNVSVWSICAGKPPPGPLSDFAETLHARWQAGLHLRWQTSAQAVSLRQAEDRRACQHMGAQPVYLDIPDCIYRTARKTHTHLYASEEALFGPLHPAESHLSQRLSRRLMRLLPPDAQIVCPLGLGNHVDHQLTRAAAEGTGRSLLYYADYPYAHTAEAELLALQQSGWGAQTWPISSQGMQAWVQAVWEHQSQISTFWSGQAEVQAQIASYSQQMGGVRLWKPSPATNALE